MTSEQEQSQPSFEDHVAYLMTQFDEHLVLGNKLKAADAILEDAQRLSEEEFIEFYGAPADEFRAFVRRAFRML